MRETAAPRRPTSWARCWLEGAGAGIIVMMPLLWLNLTPSRETHYHELLPMNSVYQGLLLSLIHI